MLGLVQWVSHVTQHVFDHVDHEQRQIGRIRDPRRLSASDLAFSCCQRTLSESFKKAAISLWHSAILQLR
jgi:hypothetical protein